MRFKELINAIDEETYLGLKRAIEIGKWQDGRRLSQEQKELTLQAIIAYEIDNNMDDEQRTGYVDTAKSDCHTDGKVPASATLKWQ